MLNQVKWGEFDVLLVDLLFGIGDVQLLLCQKVQVSGVIIVLILQDVVLIDVCCVIDMFDKLKILVLGLVENMFLYICLNCGYEVYLFGYGGVVVEVQQFGLFFFGEILLNLDVWLVGDVGMLVVVGEGLVLDVFVCFVDCLIGGGMV